LQPKPQEYLGIPQEYLRRTQEYLINILGIAAAIRKEPKESLGNIQRMLKEYLSNS
jgi:hypothetical protein